MSAKKLPTFVGVMLNTIFHCVAFSGFSRVHNAASLGEGGPCFHKPRGLRCGRPRVAVPSWTRKSLDHRGKVSMAANFNLLFLFVHEYSNINIRFSDLLSSRSIPVRFVVGPRNIPERHRAWRYRLPNF